MLQGSNWDLVRGGESISGTIGKKLQAWGGNRKSDTKKGERGT